MRHVYRFVIKHSYEPMEGAMEGEDRGGARRGDADDVDGGRRESEREDPRGGVIAVHPVGTRHRRRRPRSFGCATRCYATLRDATRRVATLISCFSYRANEGLSFALPYIVPPVPLIDELESLREQSELEGLFFSPDQPMRRGCKSVALLRKPAAISIPRLALFRFEMDVCVSTRDTCFVFFQRLTKNIFL